MQLEMWIYKLLSKIINFNKPIYRIVIYDSPTIANHLATTLKQHFFPLPIMIDEFLMTHGRRRKCCNWSGAISLS